MFWYLWAFFLGLCFGSFANACIYRWLTRESLLGRSHCPTCGHEIAWYDNIPLISFFLLKGKCRHCHTAISLSYPAIELLMGLFFVAALYMYGMTALTLKLVVLFWLFTVAFVTDMRNMEIPDEIFFIGTAFGAISVFLGWTDWADALLGFAVPAIPLLLATILIEFLIGFQGELLGGGDVKFLMGIGAVGGMGLSVMVLTVGAVLMSIMFFAVFVEDRLTEKHTYVPMMIGFYFAFVFMFLCGLLPLILI